MRQMVYIGLGTILQHEPPKGTIVEVYNDSNEFGLDMVQIKGYERIPGVNGTCYYSLKAFREPMEGEELIRELAYKTKWIVNERYPKLQKDEIKKELYLRGMRTKNNL